MKAAALSLDTPFAKAATRLLRALLIQVSSSASAFRRVLLQRYWLTMHGGELSPPDRSCGAVEQVGDDDGLAPDIMTVNLSKLSLPHHRHRFETRQSSPRGMETAEAEPRPDKALDTPVVLLDDVVEVFALPQAGAAR